MEIEEKYMQRCLQLAKNGLGNTAPNPMVGAVIVHNDLIIGEGFHREYGGAHAEPNAINSVKNKALLKDSTLYVSLEPCSHFGKTPPCVSIINEYKIPRVVIASVDPNPRVLGKGVKILKDTGVEVVTGILDAENRELNKRFFTFQEKKRPYIILKWAQSVDEFIDNDRQDNSLPPTQFSTTFTQMLNHKIRTEEQAILVGTNTVLKDNPQLTARYWVGKNPIRMAIDRKGIIMNDGDGDCRDSRPCVSTKYNILNDVAPTLIFTEKPGNKKANVSYIQLDFTKDIIPQILHELFELKITSLIVEGGRELLQSFIDGEYWDEAKVEIAPIKLGAGVSAPKIAMKYFEEETKVDDNKLVYFRK